jgi:Zn-dependent M28 family amino/carboxypeptidase
MRRISPSHLRELDLKLVSFGTRHSLSDTTSETRGIGAARRWIKSELESDNKSGGKLEVSLEEFDAPPSARIKNGAHLANVLAVLPGTKYPDRRYYVVGHYDSMPSDVMDPNSDAPGANDDGSGTSAVMEIARALAAHPQESTVVFLCTVGEEQGLIGAKYHADRAAEKRLDVRAVLSNDIVGDSSGPGGDRSRAATDRIRVFSEGLPRHAKEEEYSRIRNLSAESDSPSRELARYIADVAEREKTVVRPMLVFRLDRFLRGGDHSAFNEAGFPAVRFCEVYENYAHQHQNVREEKGPDGKTINYGDLPEGVDFEYLANVARLNAASLIHLANAPSSPPHARIITAKLEYTTMLRWDASPESDVAGYEIVWRETTAPIWNHVKDVGNLTEATIDESKDNVFFGVRAYDKDGYRSPVAFPGEAKK